MKIKVKRSDLFLMQSAINVLAQIKGSCRFAYAVAKNKKFLDDEITILRKGVEPEQALIDYEKKRIELCEKHADKDDKGKPVIVNNVYQGLGENEEFQAEMEKLADKSKDLLESRKAQLESFNEMIKDEIEFEFWKIKLSDFPDGIAAESLLVLTPIISE